MYFEARSEQQQADLTALRDESEHLKRELAASAQREISLRRQVAELEVQLARAHAEREELGRLNDVLRSERAQTLGKLLESAQIHTSDQDDDSGLDLARFIAELRSEVLTLRSQTAASAPAVVNVAPVATETAMAPAVAVARASAPAAASAPVAAHAERLSVQGRLKVSVQEVESLSREGAPLAGKSEETLFGFSVRELSAPDAQARLRAAERLKAIGHAAAAPALATALHGESVPEVQVALVAAFAELAGPEGVAIVSPLLRSELPDVRIASLKALLKLAPAESAPHLAAAVRDPDAAVRRRASLLALGLDGDAALDLGEEGVRDADPEVRALAALVLGASFGERSRAALLSALQDSERKVRQAAAQSLSRLLGEDVSTLVDLGDAQRRREARRLATLQPTPRAARGSVQATPGRGASPRIPAVHAEPDRSVAPRGPAARAEPTRQVPVAARAPAVAAAHDERLCSAVLGDLRSSIRGKSLADLCAGLDANEAAVQQACELLVARGQAVRRGLKYFQA